MITIFICKDDAVSKEITQKYLDRESLAYVNMLDGITYDQAVKAIESLEHGAEEVDPKKGEPEKTLEDQGWTATAIQEECLAPSSKELICFVGFEKDIAGEKHYASDVLYFSKKELKKYIEDRDLPFLNEKEFDKIYHKKV